MRTGKQLFFLTVHITALVIISSSRDLYRDHWSNHYELISPDNNCWPIYQSTKKLKRKEKWGLTFSCQRFQTQVGFPQQWLFPFPRPLEQPWWGGAVCSACSSSNRQKHHEWGIDTDNSVFSVQIKASFTVRYLQNRQKLSEGTCRVESRPWA